jgi:SSS family solute:Na+ symporter
MSPILFGYPVLGIWYWCTDQTIVQKILSAKSEKDGRDGAIFAGYLKILPVFLMVLPGVIGYVLFKDKIGTDYDSTLMVLMTELLPVGIRGLMAAGLLAALMSTIEAALNSVATLTAEDIIKRVRPDIADHKLVSIVKGTEIHLDRIWLKIKGGSSEYSEKEVGGESVKLKNSMRNDGETVKLIGSRCDDVTILVGRA